MSNNVEMADHKDLNVPANPYGTDIESVLISEEKLKQRIAEMAKRVSEEFKDAEEDLILVCVLKGAFYFLADFSRMLDIPTQSEFMAVRILKDLDKEIEGRDVLIVEDIIDSGLTLSWLMRNLKNRNPKSLNVITLLRKPERLTTNIDMFDIGFDIPNEFVVGYGLDFAERYRDLPYVGTLEPHVYSD